MATDSKIEWTDATWNPVTGCTEVSPGCDHCYAKTFAERWRGIPGHAFENGFDVTLRPERLEEMLTAAKWRKPKRIFVNSMSDLFHDAVPDDYIAHVFAVMACSPQHTFQVLTKRHGRMRSLLNGDLYDQMASQLRFPDLPHDGRHIPWPLPNVWLGVSVENQRWADIRIPALLQTQAAVRFLSCEPLLGPIDLRWRVGLPRFDAPRIHWVIVGGESGHGARPMHPNWARSLRDQCQLARIPFLFKQWGAWQPAGYAARVDLTPEQSFLGKNEQWLPGPALDDPRLTHTVLKRVGKGKAGRDLDGRTWDEYPKSVST